MTARAPAPAPGLWAISDIHVGHAANRAVLEQLEAHPDDWLLVVGDVAERIEHVEWALELLSIGFRQLVWVPGNHELWTPPREDGLRGVARYDALVDMCRAHGVLTPEDPYPVWDGPDGPLALAPLFLLYDYSFRDPGVTKAEAMERARATRAYCADELYLHPDPYPSREAWCQARLAATEARLDALAPGCRTVLVNHFPLRREMAHLPRIPAFELWCGTTATEDWHVKYRAEVVVTGHTHIPRTLERDGVRFEEVSLGYPREWAHRRARPEWPRRIL